MAVQQVSSGGYSSVLPGSTAATSVTTAAPPPVAAPVTVPDYTALFQGVDPYITGVGFEPGQGAVSGVFEGPTAAFENVFQQNPLPSFADYLSTLPQNVQQALTPLANPAFNQSPIDPNALVTYGPQYFSYQALGIPNPPGTKPTDIVGTGLENYSGVPNWTANWGQLGEATNPPSASVSDSGLFSFLLPAIEGVIGAFQPELTPAIALANLGESAASGTLTPLGAAGDVLSAIGGVAGDITQYPETAASLGVGANDLGVTALQLTDIANAAKLAGGGINIGEGVTTGNPLEAIGGAVSALPTGYDIYSSATSAPGTTGTNAPASADITSGIANTLGIPPNYLQEAINVANPITNVAGTAVPLIQNALNAPGNLNLTAPAPAAVPAAAPAASPIGPINIGTPLTPATEENPQQAGYRPPTLSYATLGGGLGQGAAMQNMLTALGEPV